MEIPKEFENLSKEDLIKIILTQQAEIHKLEQRLLAYENAHTPPSQQRRYPKQESSNNPIGAPKGHSGTTRETPEPNEFKELKLNKCPDCGKRLGRAKFIQKKIIEDIPDQQPLKITEFIIPHYFCNYCNKDIIPKHPELPEEGRFGHNILSEATLLKHEDRLPYRKIAEILNRRYGLQLTASTVLDINRRVADKLEADYEEIKQIIKNSKHVNADETGINVRGKNLWSWVFVSLTAVIFLIRKNRGQKSIEEGLGRNYQGILTCDGWTSYPKCVDKLQRCWAHLLREAKWIAEKHEGQARLLYNALCKMFDKIKKASSNMIMKRRLELYQRCKEEMLYWINICKSYRELRKFVVKLENGLDYWFTCILHPEIEPTNNKAERALREIVIQRKISSLWNKKGVRMKEIIMSVLATWNLRGLNTFNMLKETLSS